MHVCRAGKILLHGCLYAGYAYIVFIGIAVLLFKLRGNRLAKVSNHMGGCCASGIYPYCALRGLKAGKLIRSELYLRHHLHAHVVGYGDRLIGAIVVQQNFLAYGDNLICLLKAQLFRDKPICPEVVIGFLRCRPFAGIPFGLVLYGIIVFYIEAHGLAEILVAGNYCGLAFHAPVIIEITLLVLADVGCVYGLAAACLYYFYCLYKGLGIYGGVVVCSVVGIPKEFYIVTVFAVCQHNAVAVKYSASGSLYVYGAGTAVRGVHGILSAFHHGNLIKLINKRTHKERQNNYKYYKSG